ncbi:MAG TPA: GNAT family N-acetyltransferase [Candidatus Cybelea sp.]|nr:GNAT family N-acetyltransferase [Candidatus Cybelea sp.]
MRIIRTRRLRLVPVTATNAATLWDLLQKPDLRDYQDLPDVDRAAFLRIVTARPTRFGAGSIGRFEWLLHYLDGDEGPLGWVSMRIAEASRASAEIGYSVVRQHRSKGIATEAVAALVDEGFRRARLQEIRAYCLPENLSSRAVLHRNGFEDRGTLARGATVQGKPVDVILHALDRQRWTSALNETQAATRS